MLIQTTEMEDTIAANIHHLGVSVLACVCVWRWGGACLNKKWLSTHRVVNFLQNRVTNNSKPVQEIKDQ